MKKFLNKFFIINALIFFAINVQAETTLQFEGVVSDIEEVFSGSERSLPGGNFKGTMTFDETNLLSEENSISELTFDNDFTSVDGISFLSVDDVSSSLSEIWINEHKLTQENLASINSQLVSQFSTANFRLVFKKDSSETTVTGKLNSISVGSVFSPPPAPTSSATRDPGVDSPICEAGTDPQKIKQGEGTALWWWTQAAASARIDNGIGQVNLPTDYVWLHPSETTTYTVSVVGKDGASTSCTTTVIVEGLASPICEMGADPQIIRPGQGTALWWWTDNVSSASINNGIEAVTTPSDYKWIKPRQTTTYKMTAVNANGETTSCETTIEVTNRH